MQNKDTLTLRWVKGYTTQNVLFVDDSTICYPCGNFLIFVDTETKEERVLKCETGSIGAFTANSNSKVVAFAEKRLKPSIYVYNFPELSKTAVLTDGAELEYTLLDFSYMGSCFASFSSIPDFTLTIWNWKTGHNLCSKSMMRMQACVLCFNPMNQLQLCLASCDSLLVWNIECCNEFHLLTQVNVELPAEDETMTFHEDFRISPDCSALAYYGPKMLISAQAGLVGEMAKTFVAQELQKTIVQPVSVCWTPTSDLYVGCKKGELLHVDADLHKAVLLAGPAHQSFIIGVGNVPDWPTSTIRMNIYPILEACSVNTLAFSTKGLFTAGKDGKLYCITSKFHNLEVEECWSAASSIRNITFSSDHTSLLIATEEGLAFLYNPLDEADVSTTLNVYSGDFVSAMFLGTGTQYCVSARKLGIMQVWSLKDGKNISTLALPERISAMACCPSSDHVALATETGHIYYANVVTVETPQLIHQVFLHRMAIQSLKYDPEGQFLVAGCSDGYIFSMNAKPSKLFKVFGYTEIKAEILGVSVALNKLRKNVDCLTLSCQSGEHKCHGGTELTMFQLLGEDTAASTYINNRGMMSDVAIKKMSCHNRLPLTSAVHDSEDNLYGFCSQTRSIHKYKIIKDVNNKAFNLILQVKVQAHQLGHGFLHLSQDQEYLASAARDGFIQIRDANSMEINFETQCHSYHSGGVRSVDFSLDRQTVLTTGIHDGTLICFSSKFDTENTLRTKAAIEFSVSTFSLLSQTSKTENKVLDLIEQKHQLDGKEDTHLPISKSSTYSMASVISHGSMSESQRLNDERSTTSLEETWLEIKNKEAIKKDNFHHADVKAHLREGIKKLRQTIHLMMLENERVPPNERLNQHEFNLDLKEQKKLHVEGEEKVAKVRESIEMTNLANQYLREVIKRECWDQMEVKGRMLEAFDSGIAVTNYSKRERSKKDLDLLKQITRQRTIEQIDMKARKDIVETPPKKEEKEEEEAEEDDSKEDENLAVKGSLTYLYGLVNPYLYRQLDLHTKDQKINQIILLQDMIHNIKTDFNKEFDATYKQKEVEISRVNDRNVRIREIIMQLDMDEAVWVPTMSNNEKPERDLEVFESEISAERYLTEEQKAKLEEEFNAEQLRILLAKADNWRERALMDMMGGVLEAKKSDILKMEIAEPLFMVMPDYEWNEEQIRQAKEYTIKDQALSEEKDKYRKEELKICNLLFSLQIEEEVQNRNAQLNFLLAEQKSCVGCKAQVMQDTKMMVDQFRETYDDLVAEDRLLERGFRKEFFDVNAAMVDQLYKIYKRRPKMQTKRAQVATANPFGYWSESASEGHVNLLSSMEELNTTRFKPEHLDQAVWERLCEIRNMKIESEHQVKLKAVTLAEMQTFLQKRIEEDEHCNQMITNYTQDISSLCEIKSQFQMNLMVQLVLKQGQVEVTSDDFISEYNNSILLHKAVVEDLNNTIQLLGEKKVVIMVECKDFKKGIVQLEWEYRKMLMQMDDLHNKIRDILKFTITRQAQMYLREDNYEARVTDHIMVMERSVDGQETFHDRVLLQKRDSIKKLQKQISQLKRDLKTMDQLLKEQHISVSERLHIQEMTATIKPEEEARARFKELMQHRKLVELTKAQVEDINTLRIELEKQRMRTFPVLSDREQQT
ncbi:cilia- and flagella-associated protein 43 isoform X2 [Amblyraja radiata]|uniref:cilia- and flagella-associated protein 43 isoform X2 n=1 Tax=Amblyraja radiata TaxID=386614 RepID=UPI001401E095|nr:cilia- and flagella-associated protein 43 isoform X2 [Amblyraja radiata]